MHHFPSFCVVEVRTGMLAQNIAIHILLSFGTQLFDHSLDQYNLVGVPAC